MITAAGPEGRTFRLELAYEGSAYHGWQIQPNVATVQGEVERALAKVAGGPVPVNGSSRTDAGVHAMGQVVSFEWPADRRPLSAYVLHRALNGLLPADLSVLRLEPIAWMDAEGRPFHARHCSAGKRYRYAIWPHRIEHFMLRRTCWHVRRGPVAGGWARAHAAAQDLLGEHDFAAFRAADCDARTTIRTLHRAEVLPPSSAETPAWVVVEGTAFLKYMVRIISGTLLDIARGNLEPDAIRRMLETGDRRLGGLTAPPHGLMLEEVFYPDQPWTLPRWSMPPNPDDRRART